MKYKVSLCADIKVSCHKEQLFICTSFFFFLTSDNSANSISVIRRKDFSRIGRCNVTQKRREGSYLICKFSVKNPGFFQR